jgi:hypothetical protein
MTELQEFIDKLNALAMRTIDRTHQSVEFCARISAERDRKTWCANHNAELELAARSCERAARLFRAAMLSRDPLTQKTLFEMTLEQSRDE